MARMPIPDWNSISGKQGSGPGFSPVPHPLVSCCHCTMPLTAAAAERILSAAANYNMGILTAEAN